MHAVRSLGIGVASTGLAVLLAMQPAMAADCTRPPASFAPGSWHGYASYVGAHDTDYGADTYTDRFVNFLLDVTADGRASGALSLAASGVLDGRGDLDIGSAASWSVDAELSGVASTIHGEGTFVMDMAAMIGLSPDGDDFFHGGKQYMGHEASIEKETTFEFWPDEANCAVATGDFGENYQVQDEGETIPLTWIAFRTGANGDEAEIVRHYNDVVERSAELLGDDVVEVAELTDLVARLIGLNTVLAQPAYCSSVPEEFQPGTHANLIARQLLGAALAHVVHAALDGEYATRDLITIVTLGLEAAALEPNRCGVDQDQAHGDRAEIMRTFELALELRLEAARASGDQDEIDRILAAAYQYGFFGLLEG